MAAKTTTKRTQYIIANQHAGAIVFPRRGGGQIRNSPIVLPPGQSIAIDAEEWVALRKNRGVQNYIDAGLIKEVRKIGEISVSSTTTTKLPVPEHLQREDEHKGKQTDVTASVKQKKTKTLVVD